MHKFGPLVFELLGVYTPVLTLLAFLCISKMVLKPGALGNGLKVVEWAKVGLIAYPMQNYMRNMIGTLFLMCGGLMMSKLRILDGSPSWDFRLVGPELGKITDL